VKRTLLTSAVALTTLLAAACGGTTAPAGPHDPYMGVVVDWTALTAYADSSTTYPDSFGVRIVARYLRPDASQLDSLVSSVRFTGAGVGTKCIGDVAGSSGFAGASLLQLDVVISTHWSAGAAPSDTVVEYLSTVWDPLATPNAAWGTDPLTNILVWRLPLSNFTHAIAGTATTGPLGAAGPFTAVAEPQATYRWYNTCNR